MGFSRSCPVYGFFLLPRLGWNKHVLAVAEIPQPVLKQDLTQPSCHGNGSPQRSCGWRSSVPSKTGCCALAWVGSKSIAIQSIRSRVPSFKTKSSCLIGEWLPVLIWWNSRINHLLCYLKQETSIFLPEHRVFFVFDFALLGWPEITPMTLIHPQSPLF